MVVSFGFGFVQCCAKVCQVEGTRVGDVREVSFQLSPGRGAPTEMNGRHFIHVDSANPLLKFYLIY